MYIYICVYIYIYIYIYMHMYTYIFIFRYSEFHAKHVYNLHSNYIHYIQCSNVKNCGAKVSLFLCDVRILYLRRKSS